MTFNLDWETVHQQTNWGELPDAMLTEFVEKHYPGNTPLHFLDLGCAVGSSAIYLASKGHLVTAVDGSETAIKKLRDKIGVYKINAICADITMLEAENDSFDCIVDVATLTEVLLDDAVNVVQKARKWLKPGGRFFSSQITTPIDPDLLRIKPRMAAFEELDRMFQGFKCECQKVTRVTQNGKIASNWIVDAKVIK